MIIRQQKIHNNLMEKPRPKNTIDVDPVTAIFVVMIALLLPLILAGFFSY
ncbi:hypothetical protein STA3757_13930 [Stanieria sp. NIES-3757]|nr:hypothetical protein STA3757_13930 [Stanieria sp. NIES-3757]